MTRHADVKEVSRLPEIFSSGIGHSNLWDLEADALEARRSIIDTDAPDHTRLRRLVSKAFTPRNIRVWEDTTREIAAELLDDFVAAGGGDWVEMVAAPLPIRVILSILGVPVEDSDFLVELSNYLVEGTGDELSLPNDAFGNTTELRLLPFGSPASHALYEYAEKIGANDAPSRKTTLSPSWCWPSTKATRCQPRSTAISSTCWCSPATRPREPPSLTARWRLQTTQVSGIGSWPILR